MAKEFPLALVETKNTAVLLEETAPGDLREKAGDGFRLMGWLEGNTVKKRRVRRAADRFWQSPGKLRRGPVPSRPGTVVGKVSPQCTGEIGLKGEFHE